MVTAGRLADAADPRTTPARVLSLASGGGPGPVGCVRRPCDRPHTAVPDNTTRFGGGSME